MIFLLFPESVCSLRWMNSKKTSICWVFIFFNVETVLGSLIQAKLFFNRQTKCHTGTLARHLETQHLFKKWIKSKIKHCMVIKISKCIENSTTRLSTLNNSHIMWYNLFDLYLPLRHSVSRWRASVPVWHLVCLLNNDSFCHWTLYILVQVVRTGRNTNSMDACLFALHSSLKQVNLGKILKCVTH